MKHLRSRRWPAVWAMLILLLGTMAPALERMSCAMGCPTVVGIGTVEHCCAGGPENHDAPALVSDCCDVERTAPEHHVFTSENAMAHWVPVVLAVEMPLVASATVDEVLEGYGLCTRPPPLLTAERLSLEGIYLI